jgi:hypothetical protein
LPLAPAESVNLAVIDWTRRDDTARTEDSKLNEQIVHDQRRDRTISETVNAAIKEYQEGSNFMAGVAQSAGASGTIGKFGVATGLAGALGGATSDSSGSRDLAASTVQQLSEHITQASSAMREFQSTVVVRSVQSEKEAIETRTIVNYNHSHALTILYYEVLRHFRVTTELVRFRPAVLVKLKTDWFLPQNAELTILMYRAALEAALLDPKYKDSFDAFLRTMHRAHLSTAAAPASPAADPGAREFKYLTLSIKTGGLFSQGANKVDIHGKLQGPGGSVELVGPDPGQPDVDLNPPGSFRHPEHVNTFTVTPKTVSTVKWSSIDALWLQVHVGNGSQDNPSDVSFRSIKLVALDNNGASETLVDMAYESELVMSQTSALLLPTRRAPGLPGAAAATPEELDDKAKRAALVNHLSAHKAHYSRAIVLNQNPVDRARDLEALGVLDYVDNRPLEVLGDYVAYPCTQPGWREAIKRRLVTPEPFAPLDERLVTLPTRGVFAEARLGHCNASEEIDNTRFWDWQQSPIPHFAPEIAPVQPVTPQPQQANVQPTPFPQSLVNIVNPPSAPDPTGLAAAMTAIATPNIFRDMSGRAEVADLLKRLSDNSIKIAEASAAARGILANQAAAGSGGTGATGGGGQAGSGSPSGTGGARAAGGTAMPANEQLDRMQVVRSAVRLHAVELTPEEGRQEVKKIVSGSQDSGAPKITLADNTPEARAFFPFDDIRGETFVLARTENIPPGAENSLTVLPIDLPQGGSVEIHPGGGLMWKAFAQRPGVCGVTYQFLSDPVKGLNATTSLSVPLFVEVAGPAAMIDPAFAGWKVSKPSVIYRAKQVLEELSAVANLRFVWTLAAGDPSVQALPNHFAPGGSAEQFLTQISLDNNVAPFNEVITLLTTATGPGSPAFNGKAWIHLALLGTVDQLSGPIAALVARLTATPSDQTLQKFATEFFARVLASYIIRTLCSLVLGPATGGSGGTFAEKTGFELAQNADAGNPGSYVDLGIDAMRLRPDTIKILEEKFPVPPQFK